MKDVTEPLRETLLRQLAQSLPAESLTIFASDSSRPDVIVTDETYGVIVIDIDTAGHDATSREPIARLNQKVANLRTEISAVEGVRPHRLVLYGAHQDSLIDPTGGTAPRALGLADIERGDWLEQLESRPLDPADLSELRSALAPALCFEIHARRGVVDPGQSERRQHQIMLDAQQAAAATAPVDDVLMLTGPPGSGKTLVLAGRAKYLAAQHPSWRIVILCYNNALLPYLRQLVGGHPNVEVTTFAKFTRGEGHVIALDDDATAAGHLSRARRKGVSQTVDALLVDEGQDFRDAWIGFAIETLRKRRGGIVIACDERQALYRSASLSRAFAGRQVIHLGLERSYRSTLQILEVASTTQPKHEPLRRDEALDGQPVELIWAASWNEQAAAAAWEIRQLIDSGERQPEDIAVLVTQRKGTVWRLTAAFAEADIPHLVIDRTNADSFDSRSPEVKIMTVHGAKGYEFDVVVLFGLEAIPDPLAPGGRDQDGGQRGNVAFVGMTRARDLLLVTWTRTNAHLDRLSLCPSVSSCTWPDDYEV
jgi:UvrD-like helicase C-terminal domain/AAA domain